MKEAKMKAVVDGELIQVYYDTEGFLYIKNGEEYTQIGGGEYTVQLENGQEHPVWVIQMEYIRAAQEREMTKKLLKLMKK